MKRIKCFMLLCAFVLALTGSAWAADAKISPDVAISDDLLSRDLARIAVVSIDASFDVVVSSRDSFDRIAFAYVTLSPDLSVDKASFDANSFILRVASTDFTSADRKIGIFKVVSIDRGIISVDAFAISTDSTYEKTALRVLAPIALMEVSGDNMHVTSKDGYLTSFDIKPRTKFTSGDLDLKDFKPISADDVVIAVVSGDSKTYRKFVSSTDISKDATYVFVTNKAPATATKEAVKFDISGDAKPTSKDIVITRMIYSSDKKPNLHYGVISSDSSVVSGDGVTVYPFAWEDENAVEVKVAIYNASADAILNDINIKRYIISGEPKIKYIVSKDSDVLASKDVTVTLASPDTWVAQDLRSSDVTAFASYDIEGWKDADGKAYDFSAMKIVTSDLTLYASFDAGNKSDDETAKSGDFTVTITPTSLSLQPGSSDVLTISTDATGGTYQWYTATNATDFAGTAISSASADKYTVTIETTAKSGDKYYYFATVTSNSKTVSSDNIVTITILSGDTSGSDDTPSGTKTLSKLEVKISPDLGNTEEYAVKVGTADTIDLSLTVLATYSGDTTATDVTSTLGAKATWTLGTVSPTTTVFSLKNDSGATNTLNIASAITEGTYTVPVSVKVTSGDVSDDATVTYTIVASKSGGSGGGTPDSGDVTSGDVTSGDVTKEDAKEAVTEALKGKTNPSVTDLLGSTAAITAISKTVSPTGELDMSVLNGVTSLEGLATLLTNLGNVKSLNFADMGSSLTKIDNLDGVELESISLAGNTHITTVDLSGAQIPVVNAKGSSGLTSVNVAGNTSIASLDIGETKVASLDVAGCTNLQDLEVDNSGTTGQGSLEELNIEGCVSLKNLTLTKNKLLGIKKPTGLKNTVAIKARNQRRPHTFTSASFNFWTFLWQTILGKTTAFSATTATFEPTRITVITYTVGTTTTSTDVPASGDVTLSGTPTGIAYEYDTSGFGPSTGSSLQSASVVAADDTGMDVTLGTVGSSTDDEESPTLGSSGGGCDAGFGLGALSAVMLMFALIKKRS